MVNEEARKALSNINDATSNDLVNQAKMKGNLQLNTYMQMNYLKQN